MNRAVIALACIMVPIAAARAQRVSGIVKDSATSAFLPGAVVSLTDSTGATLTRTLSDASGRFVLALPVNGARLRVIRIGFRPRVVAVARSSGADVSVDVALARLPALLAPVDVVSRAVCSDAPDRRSAAALWEQARAGLLASVVAREARPAQATILGYERLVELGDGRVRQQQTRVQAGRTSRPFVSPDAPRLLAERGYIEEDAQGSRVYKAPDADVLLDESFAETHCFGVRRDDAEHPGEIGLWFEPARGRESLVDVRGVLWMAAAVPALHSMEFRFVGLEPAAVRAGAGGDLRFHSMPNGVVFIDRWRMRMPRMESVSAPAQPLPGQGAPRPRERVRVIQMGESGGYVLAASWDTLRFRGPLSPLAGRVVEARSARGLAGVDVSLEGTADSVRTDSAGAFVLFPVLPGRYTLVATDTAFAAFARRRSVTTTVLITETAPADIVMELPSRASFVAAICDGTSVAEGSAILFGSLAAVPPVTWSSVSVTASWLNSIVQAGAGAIFNQSEQASSVADDGSFRVCGVPHRRAVKLVLKRDGRQLADTSLTVPIEQATMRVEWPITLARQPIGSLQGVIRRPDGAPVAGADIWLPALDVRATSDSTGRFHVHGLPAGTNLVQLRHIALAMLRDTITISADKATVRDFAMTRLTTELDTVRTVSSSVKYISPALRGFENRRARAFGYFVPEAELRKQDDKRLGSIILSRTAGATLLNGPGMAQYLASSRKKCSGSALGGCTRLVDRCLVSIYVDGALMYSAAARGEPLDLNSFAVNTLAGVEFYAGGGGAATPPEYAKTDAGCGTLLLWTRER